MIKVDRIRAEQLVAVASLLTTQLADLEKRVQAGKLTEKSFDSTLYSSENIREQLWEAQHFKCCFCERHYERKWSTVEHFRPKTKADRGQGEVIGYWWLAYDLRNLYFCCQACNNAKGIHFPLEAGSALLTYPDLPWPSCCERPLLIDPGYDDPADHLTFVELPGGEWQIAPANGSARGRETIAKTGLDRDDLSSLRRHYYKKHIKPVLEDYQRALGQPPALAEEVRLRAKSLTEPDSEYSLLATVIFRSKGIL